MYTLHATHYILYSTSYMMFDTCYSLHTAATWCTLHGIAAHRRLPTFTYYMLHLQTVQHTLHCAGYRLQLHTALYTVHATLLHPMSYPWCRYVLPSSGLLSDDLQSWFCSVQSCRPYKRLSWCPVCLMIFSPPWMETGDFQPTTEHKSRLPDAWFVNPTTAGGGIIFLTMNRVGKVQPQKVPK